MKSSDRFIMPIMELPNWYSNPDVNEKLRPFYFSNHDDNGELKPFYFSNHDDNGELKPFTCKQCDYATPKGEP
mgnify:CR=1 FL=1